MEKIIKIEGVMEVMATRMKESWETSPRVTYLISVDIDNAKQYLSDFNETYKKDGLKMTYNHVLMRACALASKKYEIINCSIENGNMVIHENVNVGLAVTTDTGLIVPNVKSVETITAQKLITETTRIIDGAREMKLQYDDICGGTITITNLGMFGIESFTPIINKPEVAILGVSKIRNELVLEGDAIIEKHYLPLNFVADHRVVDGALAASYLKEVKRLVENPQELYV